MIDFLNRIDEIVFSLHGDTADVHERVTGTPGIYVNDILIKGAVPYDSFKQVIDSLLN